MKEHEIEPLFFSEMLNRKYEYNHNFTIQGLQVELTNDELFTEEFNFADTEPFRKISSAAWSSNANFFFLILKDCILLGQVHTHMGLKGNLTTKFFDEFLKLDFKKEKNKKADLQQKLIL